VSQVLRLRNILCSAWLGRIRLCLALQTWLVMLNSLTSNASWWSTKTNPCSWGQKRKLSRLSCHHLAFLCMVQQWKWKTVGQMEVQLTGWHSMMPANDPSMTRVQRLFSVSLQVAVVLHLMSVSHHCSWKRGSKTVTAETIYRRFFNRFQQFCAHLL